MPIQVVVVGCGAVAQRLYRSPLRNLEKAGIVAVTGLVDPSLEQANTLKRFFPAANCFASLEEEIDKSHSDLALILTPARHHACLTILALQRGRHVLCEKPMALNVDECRRMIAAACETNRVLAVGMIRRYFPALAQLQQIIAAGELGSVESFTYQEGRVFDWDVATLEGFHHGQGGGGGLLYDIGPHCLDALQWLLGDLGVDETFDDALYQGVESNILLHVRSGQARGTIRLSWDTPLRNRLHILGTRAEAILNLDEMDHLLIGRPGTFRQFTESAGFAVDLKFPPKRRIVPRVYAQAMQCQLAQVARAILLGETPAVSGEEALRTMGIIEEAIEAARPLPMPWLSQAAETRYLALHWNSR